MLVMGKKQYMKILMGIHFASLQSVSEDSCCNY